MVALCKAPTKSAGIGLSITAVCKNAGKKTLGQDDFFVVYITHTFEKKLKHTSWDIKLHSIEVQTMFLSSQLHK